MQPIVKTIEDVVEPTPRPPEPNALLLLKSGKLVVVDAKRAGDAITELTNNGLCLGNEMIFFDEYKNDIDNDCVSCWEDFLTEHEE